VTLGAKQQMKSLCFPAAWPFEGRGVSPGKGTSRTLALVSGRTISRRKRGPRRGVGLPGAGSDAVA